MNRATFLKSIFIIPFAGLILPKSTQQDYEEPRLTISEMVRKLESKMSKPLITNAEMLRLLNESQRYVAMSL